VLVRPCEPQRYSKSSVHARSPSERLRVNLVYRWNVDYAPTDATGTTPKTAPVGDWYTGIEFIYGDRENVDRTSGSAQRIQVTLGARF
jgi:hypothetical protein